MKGPITSGLKTPSILFIFEPRLLLRHNPCLWRCLLSAKGKSVNITIQSSQISMSSELTHVYAFHPSVGPTDPCPRGMLSSFTSSSTYIRRRRQWYSLRSLDRIISLRNDIRASSLIYDIWGRTWIRNMKETVVVIIIIHKFSLWF
mgnify:CR=1 FL=1